MPYYDRNGMPMTEEEWTATFNTNSLQDEISFDKVGNVEITTVWLGLDHQLLPAGPPLIFETMIFGGKLDGYQLRYSSESDAIQGHKTIVELIRILEKSQCQQIKNH